MVNIVVEEQIKQICKKHPHFQKHIIKVMQKEDPNFSLNELEELMSLFSSHKKLLKNKNFDLFQHTKIESAYDEISEIILNSKAVNFLKSQLSNKTKHLVDSKTLAIVKEAIVNDMDMSVIEGEIFRKILKYKTSKDLNKSMQEVIKKERSLFDISSLVNKINRENTKILKADEKEGVVVALINDFRASNALGSRSWCISTANSFWKTYVEKRATANLGYSDVTKAFLKKIKKGTRDGQNYQFFVWDLKEKFPKNRVGLTYNVQMKKTASHWGDDSFARVSIFDYIKEEEMDLSIQNLKGEALLKKIQETGVNRYQSSNSLAEIFSDLDILYLDKLVEKDLVKLTPKIKDKIGNKLDSQNIIKKDYLKYAIDKMMLKQAIPVLFNKHINKNTLEIYSVQYLMDGIDTIKDAKLIDNKVEAELRDKVVTQYLKSLATIPLENPTIRGMINSYSDSIDLSNPRKLDGIIAKSIERGIKKGQTDFITQNIIKSRKVSAKLLNYSYFNTLLAVNKRHKKVSDADELVDLFNIVLKDNLDFDTSQMTPNEKQNLKGLGKILMDNSMAKNNIILLEDQTKVNLNTYKMAEIKALLAYEMFSQGLLDDYFKENENNKMIQLNRLTKALGKKSTRVEEKMKVITLEIESRKWASIIIDGSQYDKNAWKDVKKDEKLMDLIEEKVNKRLKNKELLLSVLTRNKNKHKQKMGQ